MNSLLPKYRTVFAITLLLAVAGCGLLERLFGGDDPVGPAEVERVTYVATDRVRGSCPWEPCRLTVIPRYDFTNGRSEESTAVSCCADCRGRSQCTSNVLSFLRSTLPISERIEIPSHYAYPGAVVYTRQSGIAPEISRNLCETRYRSSDLTSATGIARAEGFLRYLTEVYGGEVGLDANATGPRDVCLIVSRAEPEEMQDATGRTGVVSGRISCARGAAARARNCRYAVVVFERAYSGRCAMRPLHTIAHEFEHIRQSIRLGVPVSQCDSVEDGMDRLEREAEAFANTVFPLCDEC